MSRAISYSMKKGPKKPRTPKPKAPKAAPKMRQKQKQSVNVKIHIDNSRPVRRAPAASRAHASPFPQPISSFPIFRDIPPPPPVHYNPAPVAQPTVVAQGFHGIPTQAAAQTPPRPHPPPRDAWNDMTGTPLSYSRIYHKDSDDEYTTPAAGNTRDLVRKIEQSGRGKRSPSPPQQSNNPMNTQVRDPTDQKGYIDIGGPRYNQLVNSGVYVVGPRGGLSKKKGG